MRLSPRAMAWGVGGLIAAIILVALPLLQPQVSVTRTPTELTTTAYSYGFFPPQTDELGNRYVWSEPHAATSFMYIGKRPFDLILTLRSAAVAGGPDAPIGVLVNGAQIAALHLDPRSPTYQTFRLTVSHIAPGEVSVALTSEPFLPKGDRRTLGTIVRSIEVDQGSAWAQIGERRWLYGILPLLGVLVAACATVSWRFRSTPRAMTRGMTGLRYLVVGSCLVGVASMLVAIAILLWIGTFDAYRSNLWLIGSIYLAGFFAAAAMHLPVWSPACRSLWEIIRQATFVQRRWALVTSLASGLLFALSTLLVLRFLASPGTGDVDDKLRWMRNIAAHGLVGGFQVSKDDYPPGTYIILAAVTKIAPHLHMGTFLGYKLTLFIFLLMSSLVCWLWTRNAPLTIALQLALFVDSMALGYNDVYFIPPLLLALWALKAGKALGFSILFTLTCLMKWQPLILVPVLLIYMLATQTTKEQRRRDVLRLAGAVVLPVAAILAASFAVFGSEFFYEFRRATTENFLSANALNFHWIVTHFLAWWDPGRFTFGPDTHRQFIRVTSPALLTAIKLLFGLIYLGILIRCARGPKSFAFMLHYAYAGYLAYFLFNTSVHENHLVPAVILGGLLWAANRRYGLIFLLTAIALNLNLLLFYRTDGVARLPVLIGGVDVTLCLSVLNVALFVLFLAFGTRLIVAADSDGARVTAVGTGARTESHTAEMNPVLADVTES